MSKLNEEFERAEATLGKTQMQQEKTQHLLDRAEAEVEQLQERIERQAQEIRRVRLIFLVLYFEMTLYYLCFMFRSKVTKTRSRKKSILFRIKWTNLKDKLFAFRRNETTR